MSIVLVSCISKNRPKILSYLAVLLTYHTYNEKLLAKNDHFLGLVYLKGILTHTKYQSYSTPKNKSKKTSWQTK